MARRDREGYEDWHAAVERAIREQGAEAVLRQALDAMWRIHATRWDVREGRRGGPDSYYAGVGAMRSAICDAIDPRMTTPEPTAHTTPGDRMSERTSE